MMQVIKAEGAAPTSCRRRSASPPWLDLTCEGGSHIVNEAYDLMMRRDRLLGIATAYLGGATAPNDPRVALLAPEATPSGDATNAFALPPCLVHA